ncbi:secreted phosphoprotein 24 [Centrocercus urophasianus]|uniref:secreted phosphoprotein 24 n=1 Tax=Centrocercus urophasianus TaxID=9002 RepID=UPI001C64CA2B|nr:secreted phosphoprotein 24 [Centrocercus urophasianus]XP_042678467.1 secreted phosphoprotein 24 [Centrocercus urophasianus]XP_042678468.1 secreted phosphoprotein 24 [Centrocercus urophasianus]XP_042678469.1 secreted phosphoprotein 24 [Centrocercus urophasianus]XP_042678470.1 secreted phosphoprotein 24 [Centrocercus urophasianus]XP_042730826.1 secreted phosphoprotein 24 [Lagopus leucura]XP_042730827.1 secreted phosphoprotein 24 [Lagopus leucura]XP_042730828.1 secreted phosphoprotein 24 [La
MGKTREDFERHTMRSLIFVLTLSVFSCSGFPVYDYELPVTEEALNASIARINSQSWGPNLYGVVRSHVRHVDMWNSNDYRLELQLSIRETECTKASGRDPFTCGFKVGPFVPTAVCKSVVEVSSEQIVNVIVRCHQSTFSSESMSSEEMMHMLMTGPSKRGSSRSEAFSSRGRGRINGDWNKPDRVSPGKIE